MAALGSSQKKPLDHSVYDGWKSIRSVAFTNDGAWIGDIIAPQEGDAILEVRPTGGGKTLTIDRVSTYRFSQDSKFLVATVIPKLEDTKKARRDKVKPEDMPKNALVIVNLASGERFEREKVAAFTMAEEDKGWVVYRPEPPKPEPAKPGDAKPSEQKPEDKDKPKKKSDHKPGDPWIVRELATGKETTLENVTAVRFNKSGTVLAYTVSTKDGAGDGVVLRYLAEGKNTPVVTQMGRYTKLVLTEDGRELAFQTDKDDYMAKKPSPSIYLSQNGGPAKLMAKEGAAGMPSGSIIADGGILRFSKSGKRLFIPTAPKPADEKKDDTPDDEKVSVDVWTYKDPLMMPQQLLQATAERNRTYDTLVYVDSGKIVPLETKEMPSVTIGADDDGPMGLGQSSLLYQREISWGLDYNDLCLVNLETGAPTPLITKFQGNASLSNTGNYVLGYDSPTKDMFAIDVRTGKRVSLNAGIPHPTWDEEYDNPDFPPPYGTAGATKDDGRILLYDKYDIWLVDPAGKAKPMAITSGRTMHNAYRIIRTDPDQDYVGDEFLATVTNESTKASGLFRVKLDGRNEKKLIWGDKRFTFSGKAKNADKWAITRQDFIEYPDVWLTNADMENPSKLTDANPQQKDFNWGKAELVTWRSNDGQELQGILIKPEDFDYSKKYPLISYFYERDSDTLNQYRPPAPSASTISLPMYASNGYLIFIPDIPYKEGYPGESAVSAITSGVNSIVARGYVDPTRLAIQGQSWGGYQVGYLVTETNMFRAACAGAPVSDMVSAYDGIRWGSGLVRQMQYEHGQSRIAGTLWDKPLRFIENSPIFHVDKVQTPLLIMSNDKDGSVPWYQGIEYFSAMRRLNKPCWLVVYNEEDHNLVQRKNRKDWSIRMQQFFDYYLKGAPMPKWMAEGVPAVDKGKTYGFELTKGGGN